MCKTKISKTSEPRNVLDLSILFKMDVLIFFHGLANHMTSLPSSVFCIDSEMVCILPCDRHASWLLVQHHSSPSNQINTLTLGSIISTGLSVYFVFVGFFTVQSLCLQNDCLGWRGKFRAVIARVLTHTQKSANILLRVYFCL